MYEIEISEGCATCDRAVLRDSHGEHIIIEGNRRYCSCRDIY